MLGNGQCGHFAPPGGDAGGSGWHWSNLECRGQKLNKLSCPVSGTPCPLINLAVPPHQSGFISNPNVGASENKEARPKDQQVDDLGQCNFFGPARQHSIVATW